MSSKKSQLTIFMILGIIILAIFALLFYAVSSKGKLNPNFATADEYKKFAELCFDLAAQDALYFIGQRSGYLELKDDLAYTNYLYKDGEKEQLTNEDIEQELSKFIAENVYTCMKKENATLYRQIAKRAEPIVSAEILPNSVVLRISSNMGIKKADSTADIGEFRLEYNLKLDSIIKTVNSITSMQSREFTISSYDFEANKLQGSIFREGNSLIVRVTDRDSFIKMEPYEFWFAMG